MSEEKKIPKSKDKEENLKAASHERISPSNREIRPSVDFMSKKKNKKKKERKEDEEEGDEEREGEGTQKQQRIKPCCGNFNAPK